MGALISVEQFRREARSGKPASPVYRVSKGEPAPIEGTRIIRFCFSDGSIDREGDTIDPDGWDIADFLGNPVALFAHDSSAPPIGKASNVKVEFGRLMGDIEFAPPETYGFADTIYRLTVGGYLRAVSVGFQPVEYSFVDNDPDRGWGIDFKRQQLLEISVVPVPANPNALAEAGAKGINTAPLIEWAERCLDSGGKVILPRSELERLRKQLKESTMSLRPAPRRRADGANEEDPTAGGALLGTCGRDHKDACGMTDPQECSVHRDTSEDEGEEKRLKRLLRRLLGRTKGDDEPDGDELPLEHHDAVRMAHKHMKSAVVFHTEATKSIKRAADLLSDVVDSLEAGDPDDDGRNREDAEDVETDDEPDPDDSPEEKRAKQLRRAARLKKKHQA